jgi:hypothetical protein
VVLKKAHLFLRRQLDEIEIQLFFIGKILVKAALGDAGALDNARNGGIFVIMPGKFFYRQVENGLPFIFGQVKKGWFRNIFLNVTGWSCD